MMFEGAGKCLFWLPFFKSALFTVLFNRTRMSYSHLRALGAVLVLGLMGCSSNRFYAPNTVNLPYLSHKGDATVSGGASISPDNIGLEAQASYSPVKQVGVVASLFSIRHKGSYSLSSNPFGFPVSSTFDSRTTFGEVGLGLYQKVGKEQEHTFSLYGTVGMGRMHNTYEEPDKAPANTTWNLQRYALQPGIRLQHKRLHFGTALRASYIRYSSGNIDARVSIEELARIELIEERSPFLVGEVLWTIGYHLSPVILSLNSTSVALGNPALNELGLASNHVSLMVSFNLHEIKGDKKKGKKK